MAILEGALEVAAEDVVGTLVSPPVLVVGALLAAPIVAPRLSHRLRPLTKKLVKGAIVVYDKGKETITELAEQFSDLVAESRAELAAAAAASGVGAAQAAVPQVETAAESVGEAIAEAVEEAEAAAAPVVKRKKAAAPAPAGA
ncbi:MAG: DUF5132 domain-containing protein [Anaerolineae bacterium]|nr:DUF5132 domain-containing protein [Anaerolineae bacterium]